MALKEVNIPPIKTDNKNLQKNWDTMRRAIEELKKEVKRLNNDKQDK